MPDPTWLAHLAWARAQWPGGDPGPLAVLPVAPEGSARLFLRLRAGGFSLVLMANPANPPENRAWSFLAAHLGALGLPVARVLAQDLAGGRFLMEDLGQGSLQERALALAGDRVGLRGLYQPVLALLARMQALAGQGLDLGICFDGPRLDPGFLRVREAGYFLEQYVAGACGRGPGDWPAGLEDDLALVCQGAGQAQPQGFVHRDFQSRNLVWQDGRLGLVDFQGGRLGPAQYDLAALLHDPYVDLPWELRQELLQDYLGLRAPLGGLDSRDFLAGWPLVSLSRLMQALGAYAFLSRVKGKAGFAAYAPPALAGLQAVLALPGCPPLPALGRLIEDLPAEPLKNLLPARP